MLDHQHGTPDQLGVNDRTSHFYKAPNNHTGTQYLATLSPIVRRYYITPNYTPQETTHHPPPPQPATVTPKGTAGTTNPTTRPA